MGITMQERWYVAVNGAAQGPHDRETFWKMFIDGVHQVDALVCRNGMKAWTSLANAGFPTDELPPRPAPVVIAMPATTADADRPDVLPTGMRAVRDGFDWPAPNSSVLGPRPPAPPKLAVDDDGWQDTEAAPWSRHFARSLDTMVFGLALWAIVGLTIEATTPSLFHLLFGANGILVNPIISSVATFAIVVPLLAVLLGLSGTTLGKWIFGVRVTRTDGRPIGIAKALERELTVFLKGVGLGIPLVALITHIVGYKTLTREGQASWDAGAGWVVTHRPAGNVRTTLFVIGVVAWVATILTIRAL
jgi:uncharacterized RDD family membrane protein YckC